jgi:hypothetical protein
MLCPGYQKLLPREKRDYIGELLHAVQSDDELFELGSEIIQVAYRRGIFDGVKINPIDEPEKPEL